MRLVTKHMTSARAGNITWLNIYIAQCFSNINQHESKYKITPLVGKLQGSGVGWAVGKQWNIYHLLLQLLHYMAILAAWCGVGPINITRHWRVLDTVIMFSAALATHVMDDPARVGCLMCSSKQGINNKQWRAMDRCGHCDTLVTVHSPRVGGRTGWTVASLCVENLVGQRSVSAPKNFLSAPNGSWRFVTFLHQNIMGE